MRRLLRRANLTTERPAGAAGCGLRLPLLLVCFIVGTDGGPASAQPQATQPAFESFTMSEVPPAPLEAARLERVRDGMTLGAIVDELGRGWVSTRSGTGIIEWSFSDGRRLLVRPREYEASEVVTRLRTEADRGTLPTLPATRATTTAPAAERP